MLGDSSWGSRELRNLQPARDTAWCLAEPMPLWIDYVERGTSCLVGREESRFNRRRETPGLPLDEMPPDMTASVIRGAKAVASGRDPCRQTGRLRNDPWRLLLFDPVA
jgi:hypothetical protein